MANEEMKKFSTAQLLNFCLGFFGLQFAWQMRIILSGPVTEALGASPFIFGLIWLAGPVTGIVVQPIIGALSDVTQTPFGRRVTIFNGRCYFSCSGTVFLTKKRRYCRLIRCKCSCLARAFNCCSYDLDN